MVKCFANPCRFFFHERVKYVNLWAFCLLGGPFLGPFIAAWLIQVVSWRADYGVLAGLHGLSTLIVVILGDETLYDRNNPQRRAKAGRPFRALQASCRHRWLSSRRKAVHDNNPA